MNEIDKLIIKIEADTKQLKAELNKIEGKIKTTGAVGGAAFGMGAAGLGGKLKALAGPLAIGAVVVGMTKLASASVRVGMEFEDLKDSLNTVFGSIQAGDKAFDRILEFSTKTPFQIETVSKAFIALKSAGIEPNNRMLQTFADTASTSVDQLGVFEALVRTVQRSASGGLGLEELNMIMDRGIDVLGILNEELGLSKDEIAKFGATAQGAKLITDALINGLERKFGGAMESKMDNLSTKVSNMTIAFKQLGDDIQKEVLSEFLKNTTDRITALAEAILFFRRSARSETGVALTKDIPIDISNLEAKRDEVERIRRNLIADAKTSIALGATPDSLDPLETYEQSLSRVDNQLKAINNELTIQNAELVKQATNFRLNGKTQADVDKETLMRQGELQNAATFIAKEYEKLKGDVDMLSFSEQELNEILAQGTDVLKKAGIDGENLAAVYAQIQGASSDLATTFDTELRQAVINQSNAFTTDFVNSLMDGENALDSFKNFAKSMVSQIIAIFLQMAVVNEILNNVFNLTGTNNALPTFRNAKAGGGKVQAGSPVLVGERGMEMFVPDTGGRIMNNMNTKNSMGGGTTVINQSINFATGVVPTVRAEVMKMMPQIAEVTKGAVAEAAMRGGNYRRMLQGG